MIALFLTLLACGGKSDDSSSDTAESQDSAEQPQDTADSGEEAIDTAAE
jgi:hypothetical protein